MFKIIIIIGSFLIGAYIGVILAVWAVSNELIFKPLEASLWTPRIYEDYLTGPFDNPGQFNYGWQGEKNPVQLQGGNSGL